MDHKHTAGPQKRFFVIESQSQRTTAISSWFMTMKKDYRIGLKGSHIRAILFAINVDVKAYRHKSGP